VERCTVGIVRSSRPQRHTYR